MPVVHFHSAMNTWRFLCLSEQGDVVLQGGGGCILVIFHPVISLLPFMPSHATGAKECMGLGGGGGKCPTYMGSKG